jgi:hypothetical protein
LITARRVDHEMATAADMRSSKTVRNRRGRPAPHVADRGLFVYVYVLIHDLIAAGPVAIPPRPGPAPGCSDAELLTIVMVHHLLGRRSEAAFLAEVAGDVTVTPLQVRS